MTGMYPRLIQKRCAIGLVTGTEDNTLVISVKLVSDLN